MELPFELAQRGLSYQRQVDIPLIYDGCRLDSGFRIDLLVEREVVVELKSVDKLLPIHEAQLMTYLRLSRKKVGLLINFNVRGSASNVIRVAPVPLYNTFHEVWRFARILTGQN